MWKLDLLDSTICNNFSSPDSDETLQEYENLKSDKQAMFRAKCRRVENGERPTKYFFNVKKRNYNQKTISELRLQDKSTKNNENVIRLINDIMPITETQNLPGILTSLDFRKAFDSLEWHFITSAPLP